MRFWYQKKKQVVAIGQTIAIANQVTAGLGRHINSLTTSQIDRYQKVSIPAPFPPLPPTPLIFKNQKFESYLNAWVVRLCCSTALYTITLPG